MPTYEVRLVGKNAKLGDVAMVDVARLMLDVQTVVARASGAVIGRPPKATGRWEGTIEEATKLRLVKIKRGSVTLEVKGPNTDPADGELDLGDESLADLGWSTATSAISGSPSAHDPDVLVRLLRLADRLSLGTRFDAVEFRTEGETVARLDGEQRQRIRAVLERRQEMGAAPPAVTGVLYEADFERHTARVRTQDNTVVEVIFEDEQAAEIKQALRERSEFQGDVTFDPITNSVKTVRLRRITRFEQLLLGGGGDESFWSPLSYTGLAEAEGTQAVDSFEHLRDTSLSDADYQNFVDVLS